MRKIGFTCCTYQRPDQLARMIGCYLQFESYSNIELELVVLDDAGQYEPATWEGADGRRVRIYSRTERFQTLGEKRNFAAGLLDPHTDLLFVLDDDDVYLPHHLVQCLEAFIRWEHDHPDPLALARPYSAFLRLADGVKEVRTGNVFHSGFAIDYSDFGFVGGYPNTSDGEDVGLVKRFTEMGLPIAEHGGVGRMPSLVYSWYADHQRHISAHPGDTNQYQAHTGPDAEFVPDLRERVAFPEDILSDCLEVWDSHIQNPKREK